MIANLKRLLVDDGMKARAFRSTLLTGASFGVYNVVRLAGNLILTRLLFPEAFGLMAIVYVIVAAVRSLSDLGINAAIVQNENGSDPLFLNTAWSLQIIRGLLLTLLIWALAVPMADFYEQPQLVQLLPVIGLSALVEGFNSTRLAEAQRNLRLGRVTVLELANQIIGLGTTIVLAVLFKSVWALVFGYLIGITAMTILSHIMLSGHANRIAFHGPFVRNILSFGTFVFLSTTASFLLTQGDRIILGKLISLENLGFYTIAYFLATVPVVLSQALSSKVVFPLYSRRSPWESETNRQNIFKMRRLITAATLFGLMFFAFIGEPLVKLLYDSRYQDAGPLVSLLAIAHMPLIIVSSYIHLALAAGHSGRFAFITSVFAVSQIGSMLILGSWFGLYGVISGLAVAPVLAYPILVWMIRPYRGWDVWHDIGFALLVGLFFLLLYSLGIFDSLGLDWV